MEVTRAPVGTLRHQRRHGGRQAWLISCVPSPATVKCGCGRWNLIGILQHPATRELDYYCRLDTHSNILSNVSDDMFGHMAAHRLHYGFVARCAPKSCFGITRTVNPTAVVPSLAKPGLTPSVEAFDCFVRCKCVRRRLEGASASQLLCAHMLLSLHTKCLVMQGDARAFPAGSNSTQDVMAWHVAYS